jgi:predicted peptidase
MGATGILFILLLGSIVFFKIKTKVLTKQVNTEIFRNKELQKKYKLAVDTVAKMEKNPDLIHSREFNLDYLRMRMAEDVFHYAIIVQIKMKVKQQISIALRPTQTAVGEQSTAGTARQVDSIFDVEYETGIAGDSKKRVLFRIQVRLMKLPTQSTSTTINEIIDCLETYLSASDEHDNWQPTIQGRIVHIEWDQKAKPTPLLVLEQSNEGVNVTFRTTRPAGMKSPPHETHHEETTQAKTQGKTQRKKSSKSESTKLT